MSGPKAARSIALRLTLIAALWISAALVAGGFLLSNIFRAPLETAFDQRLEYLLQSLLSAAEIAGDGGTATVRELGEARFDTQYSGLYWQIVNAGTGAVIGRSRSLWDIELNLPELATAGASVHRLAGKGPLNQGLRIVAIAITDEESAGRYLFAVAADTQDLAASIATFQSMLVWSLGVLGAGLVLAVVLQVYVGLLPLKRLRAALQAVRDGRAERLDSDFPSEVKPLADELNGLLEHTQGVLARARAHVGNMAHALKTPLTVLANEGETPSEELPAIVRQQTAQMRRQVDHHLSRARTAGHGSLLLAQVPVAPVLQAIARTLEKLHRGRGLVITATCPAGLSFRGERTDLEEMLGNLSDNACTWAVSQVRIGADMAAATGQGGPRLVITLEDDGPGIAPELRETLFARGQRADESKPGSGLGLAIVRDIAALYGGDVALADADLGGLKVMLSLPGGTLST